MTEHIKANWRLEHSYAELPELFYSKVDPTPVENPKLVILNRALAEELGLNPAFFETEAGTAVLAGNLIPKEAEPLAQAYAGHQFANFTKLGDGRAVMLGEQITPKGERVDLQYKGSGRTPYSRGGDGRAALGPMLREYIISEGMHGLGIPTTRSLSVVETGESVAREVEFPGGIMLRTAHGHMRVGTFQYAATWGSLEELKALADYAIKRHDEAALTEEQPYVQFFRNTVKRQAKLIADWQLVGFIHGVMNTDNMTISGESIDYGPCAFMDTYHPDTVFSSIDREGRYAYVNQPYIGGWNLARLGESLLPLLADDEEQSIEFAQEVLGEYTELYADYWLDGMRAKLGLLTKEAADEALIRELLDTMVEYRADYTNTFVALSTSKLVGHVIFHTKEFKAWYEKWTLRLEQEGQPLAKAQEAMRKVNPAVIPRNHRVEEALEAAVNDQDYTLFYELVEVLQNPFAYSERQKEYAKVPATTELYQTYCGT